MSISLDELVLGSELPAETADELARSAEAPREAAPAPASPRRRASDTPLSAERERLLVRRALAGDETATELIVEAHRRLVFFLAKQYVGRGVPFEDLVQEGTLGLLEALRRVDVERTTRFAGYAGWWIRQYQARAVSVQGDGLPLTAHQLRQRGRVRGAIARFEQEEGRAPCREELVDLLEGGEGQLARVEGYASTVTLERAEQVAVEDPITDLLGELDSRELERALERMPERNRSILRWRYGIGCPALSLNACGRRMNVSAQRAQQIERRALRYLRYAPEAADIRALLAASGVDWRADPER